MIQPSNESKIKFLQNVCKRAGKEIKELKEEGVKTEIIPWFEDKSN